jgi:hypothetical protein
MNLLKELDSIEVKAVTLFVDNLSAINLAKNPIAYGRSKHIEMRFHYLRELVCEEQLKLAHCRSEEQLADLLKKVVTNEVFKRLLKSLSLRNVEHLT